METDVEDFLMEEEDDNQFSLEEMEDALQNNDNVQLSSSDSQKSVLKELNRSPAKLGKRLAASRPITYRQISSSNSSDISEVNTSSSNSSDNTAKQPAPKKKRIQRLKKPLAKKKKYMDKENISENILETINRPALLDRTNSSERSTKFPKVGKDVNSDKVVSFAKDGKDLTTAEKAVTDPSAAVKEVKTEKPIPVYKQAIANARLTPPPVDNKMDLYEFEVDENEQPVKKKKKRQPRVMKSRRKIAAKPVKTALQNTIVPERTISLRCDNTVKDKTLKSKTGVVRFDIVKSIEKHTDVLEWQKKMVTESNPTCQLQKCQSSKPVTECVRQEPNTNFDFLIYINNDRKDNDPYVTVYKNLKEDSFEEGACCGWDENLQPVLVLNDPPKDLNGPVQNGKQRYADSFEGACSGWDENLQPVMVLDESEVLGRDHNDTEVDFGFVKDVVDKHDSKSSTENSSIKKAPSKNQLANKSAAQIRQNNRTVHHPVPQIRSVNPVANNSSDKNDSVIDFDNNFGFDDESDNVADVTKDKSSSSNANHSVPKVRSTNQTANRTVQRSNRNESKIGLNNNFGFDDESDNVADVTKDKSSSSNANHSVPKVRSPNQTANRTVQRSNRNESKIGLNNNFGFDDDSTELVDVNKDNSKISNTSTLNALTSNASISNASTSNASISNASTSNASISNASTSNESISNASTSSRLETEKTKKPEAEFTDVIKRLKGQLNITAVSTPVSTKQTKLNFNFRNKSTVSNDSAADTSLCSPIAQQTTTNNGGLTPTFLKPPRKSYTHTPKAAKTVRFGTSFAYDQNELKDDDDAAEDLFEDTFKEKSKAKKVNQTYKKAGKTGKKEEKEIERLVSAINSQFQKVEDFQLCVEK